MTVAAKAAACAFGGVYDDCVFQLVLPADSTYLIVR